MNEWFVKDFWQFHLVCSRTEGLLSWGEHVAWYRHVERHPFCQAGHRFGPWAFGKI